MIFILDQQANRRSGRAALEYAGENLYLVRFLALTGVSRGACASTLEIGLDICFGQLHARRAAIDDAPDCRSMALPERRDSEQGAERVSRHGSCAWRPDNDGSTILPAREHWCLYLPGSIGACGRRACGCRAAG